MKKIHFVSYVYNSTPKLKKFNSIKTLRQFVKDFKEEHYGTGFQDGYWIDYIAINVEKLELIDPSVAVEE